MTDSWTRHLADKGYTALALPSHEFELLTLVFERDGARGHDASFDQLAPGVRAQLAPPEQNASLPAIAGERTRSVGLAGGLKLLSGLLAALGGGVLGLEAGFRTARKLTFAYAGLSSETLNAVELQLLLNTVPQPPEGGLLRAWMDDHLYVVTSVLRARRVSVTAHDDDGSEVGVDVPIISGAISGNIDTRFSGADHSTVTFVATEAVPVAVRLYQVVPTRIADRRMLSLKTVRDGTVEIKSREASADEPRPAVLAWDGNDAMAIGL